MRPIYERADNRIQQQQVMDAFCTRYACTAIATEPLCGWDFEVAKDGRAMALVEVKVRINARAMYPSYLISARKVDVLRSEAAARSVVPLLVVRWSDQQAWVRLDLVDYELGFGGRVDRNDPADLESVALIQTSLFTPF